jgi:Tol biopolymer transport system component
VDIEKIAYTTYEDGVSSLRIMNPDGTDVTHVTPKGVGSWYPAWSPNGKLLAFLSLDKDGKMNLFVLKKGESDYQQLTQFEDWVLAKADSLKSPLTWSPLSDEIAFIYRSQIWKVNIKSKDIITLFTSDPNFAIVMQEWAPHRDNKYIAFIYSQGVNYGSVYLVNPRQKDSLDLCDSDHTLLDLSWSPDALKVAYSVKPDSIYTASSNTSIPARIIYGASPDLGPLLRYSPVESGSPMMLMLAKKDLNDAGYRVALLDQTAKSDQDSGALKFLSGPGVTNAIWSPDGSKIGYIIDGNFWVMDNSGNNKKLISPDGITHPDWSKK